MIAEDMLIDQSKVTQNQLKYLGVLPKNLTYGVLSVIEAQLILYEVIERTNLF